MNKFADESFESEEDIKLKFFDTVKNENITEIIRFFKDENLKVWLFKEEEEYTGNNR
jgi:hypothetical protein